MTKLARGFALAVKGRIAIACGSRLNNHLGLFNRSVTTSGKYRTGNVP